MSFGAGHIQDMNNRMKQNRSSKPSKRSKFKENNQKGLYSKENKSKKKKLTFYNFDAEANKRIIKRTKKQYRNEVIIYIIASIIVMASIVFLIYLMN